MSPHVGVSSVVSTFARLARGAAGAGAGAGAAADDDPLAPAAVPLAVPVEAPQADAAAAAGALSSAAPAVDAFSSGFGCPGRSPPRRVDCSAHVHTQGHSAFFNGGLHGQGGFDRAREPPQVFEDEGLGSVPCAAWRQTRPLTDCGAPRGWRQSPRRGEWALLALCAEAPPRAACRSCGGEVVTPSNRTPAVTAGTSCMATTDHRVVAVRVRYDHGGGALARLRRLFPSRMHRCKSSARHAAEAGSVVNIVPTAPNKDERNMATRSHSTYDASDRGGAQRLRVKADGEDRWSPSQVRVALNATVGHHEAGVVVLDGLVSDDQRAGLMSVLRGADASTADNEAVPADRWSRSCCDSVGTPPTWGMRRDLLRQLEHDPPPCVLELHSRLCMLYPEYAISHMPSFTEAPTSSAVVDAQRTSFVANAAEHGDAFSWHYDADPRSLPPSAWRDEHGDYANGTPGKPLLVSLIVYCNAAWCEDWDAETLFLADEAGVGLLVQPRPGRACLMHQDVLHRVSAPSRLANRPRYSLVWKLVFTPIEAMPPRDRETVCRPEWGRPLRIGA